MVIVEFFLPSAPNTYDTLVGFEIFFCASIVVHILANTTAILRCN